MSKTFREAYRELESRPVPDERLMVAGPDRAEEQREPSTKAETLEHRENIDRLLSAAGRKPQPDDQA